MILVFISRTNNIKRFIQKLQHINRIIELNHQNYTIEINEPFALITYTDKLGMVPETVEKFLEKNYHFLKAVAASGNRNFGNNFANAANVISEKYNVPILLKFELSGTQEDVDEFQNKFLNL
ncbi:protein involved in ribonucleotide reduction [Mycoplasmoides fastidiosum]|uniref:Protein involved in ribonucleotide reduction n=1 Tax=Mycoplasmoides fastidiosum TaxID=92758 RepID=A0ABU0LYH1_9BACT|nr:class Ib ribonucleoside-diphosphate reductase assembly flavoprotein NrdI [Mycoplasmoides fastidiosum]MDQ0513754.1 protein involved in ribonucleotide reduction [Mycoplasmoides fastidiosum]UUD37825.1 class Ib ribonucleoside-diphosphate reductase assembly flavoprotein NrdI [Mycoplasmoides fastidiosum]